MYDDVTGHVILAQGVNFNTSVNDQWSYDGAQWTQIASPVPVPTRLFSGAAYDLSSHSVMIYGGTTSTGGLFSDTWAWDGSAFEQLLLDRSPGARGAHAMATSPDGKGVILHSGNSAVTSSEAKLFDMWQLRYDNREPEEQCLFVADADGDGLAGCADPDCWTVCTPGCPPGGYCDAAAPKCGDGVCGPVENCRICATDCACTAYCGDGFCDAGETQADCPGDCTP